MQDVIHFYRVKDLGKVVQFYQNELGLTLHKDQGECLIYHLDGHGKIGFCLHFPKHEINQSCITFVYASKDEINEMYKKLSKTINCEYPKENVSYGIYHFFATDPNGLVLEFQVFLD